MSYIPDCREDEYYKIENLNESDQEFVQGFDWNTEIAADTFIDNFVDSEGDSYIGHVLRQELPEELQCEYEIDLEIDERQVKTYADYIRLKLLEWIESCRNNLIVGIIDGYGEGEEE